MNDVIDPAGSLPFKFPRPADEAYARAQEFRRLPTEDRWKQIAQLMELGIYMVRDSPRQAEIQRRMEAQEAEWQRLQKKLFSQYDK